MLGLRVKQVIVAVAFVLCASGASAATITCDSSISLKVDDFIGIGGSNDGCEIGSTNQVKNNPSPGTVNPDSPFGFSDWIYSGKQNVNGAFENGVNDIGFAYNGGVSGGTWSVDGALANYTNLMIIQKAGGGNIVPDTWVAYLFNASFNTSGDIASAFVNGNNGPVTDISNVSAWVRGSCPPGSFGCGPSDTTPIPLPAGLPLLLSALGLGAFLRIRARKLA